MIDTNRLKHLREELGYTQKEVASRLGVTQQNYQKWESGFTKSPTLETINELATIFNTTIEYLTNTEILPIYQSLSEKRQNKLITIAKNQLKEQQEEEKIIYLKEKAFPYDVISESSLSAGYGCGYDDTQETYTVYWDKDINYDYAIAISGESMEPDYHDGDIALIRKRYTYEYDNKVCAVDDIENGKLYIKKIHVNKDDGTVTLESLNKQTYDDGSLKYPDITLENTEKLKLIGLVVDSFTPLEVE